MNRIDQTIQQQVIKLLSWSADQHTQFMYDCGIAYLTIIAGSYPHVFTQISKSKRFWNWWYQHWEKREKQFLEIIDESDKAYIDVQEEYNEIHHPGTLAAAIYLNGQVLEESYANLIFELTKDQFNDKGEAAPEATAMAGVER